MADFKKLLVWQKAHALALTSNKVAERIRGNAHVSLKSQIIRAAMSIPANIVEGRAQRSEREFARYLRIAIASSSELESHAIMALDIGAIPLSEFTALLDKIVEVRKMLNGLIGRLGTG